MLKQWKKRIVCGATSLALIAAGIGFPNVWDEGSFNDIVATAGGRASAESFITYLETGSSPNIPDTNQQSGNFYYIELSDGTVEVTGFDYYSTSVDIPSTIGGKRVSRVSFNKCSYDTSLKIQNVTIPSGAIVTTLNTMINSPWYLNAPVVNNMKIASNTVLAYNSDSSLNTALERFNKNSNNFIIWPTVFSRVRIIDENYNYYYCNNTVSSGGSTTGILSDSLVPGKKYKFYVQMEYREQSGSYRAVNSDTIEFVPTKAYSIYRVSATGTPTLDQVNNKIINGGFTFAEDAGTSQPTSVTVPEGVTSIADSAFSGAPITSVTLPSTLKYIGNNAFASTQLTAVDIPASVTVGGNAFYNAKQLTSVNISASADISSGAFDGTPWLENKMSSTKFFVWNNTLVSARPSVTGQNNIPDSVTKPFPISYFYKSSYNSSTGKTTYIPFEHIKMPAGITSYEKNQMDSITVKTLEIPGTAVSIGDYAFACTHGLTTLTLNEGTRTIGSYAFTGYADDTTNTSTFTSVTVPASVTSIGSKALGYAIYKGSGTNDYSISKIPGFKIYCTAGSEGERYARANGFAFEIVNSSADTPVAQVALTYVPDPNDTKPAPVITDLKYKVLNSQNRVMKAGSADSNGNLDLSGIASGKYTVEIDLQGFAPRKLEYTTGEKLGEIKLCKYGDVTGNGKINEEDISRMQQMIGEWAVHYVYSETGDFNGDGISNEADLSKLQQFVGGWNVDLNPKKDSATRPY